MQHLVIDRAESDFSDSDDNNIGKAPRVKATVNTNFLDATDNYLPTSIDAENVLVFGEDQHWNHELALLIQRAFGRVAKITKIISAANFFTISALARQNKSFSYIVICDTFGISVDYLAELKSHVSTVCSFKIPGLEWKLGEYGQFDISDRAQSILNALNIKTEIAKGLLASLDQQEFCLMNSQNLFKRRI